MASDTVPGPMKFEVQTSNFLSLVTLSPVSSDTESCRGAFRDASRNRQGVDSRISQKAHGFWTAGDTVSRSAPKGDRLPHTELPPAHTCCGAGVRPRALPCRRRVGVGELTRPLCPVTPLRTGPEDRTYDLSRAWLETTASTPSSPRV